MATYYVATTGNDSTGDGSSGNPYATPGKALAVAIAAATAGFIINVKAGTYNVTSASTNIAAGCLNFSLSGTQTAFNVMQGYTTVVGDGGVFTMVLGGGLAGTVITTNNANSYNIIRNVAVTGNATSGASALNHGGRSNRVVNFKASGFTGGANYICLVGNNAYLGFFEISGGNTSNFAALSITTSNAMVEYGWVHGNAGRGVDIAANAGTVVSHVASTDHTGANGMGFQNQGSIEVFMRNCIADNNAQDGFVLFGTDATMVAKLCIATRNGGYGFNNLTAADGIECDGCATYSNTSGAFHTTPNVNVNAQVLTGLPFTGSGNYALNNTAGAGAACRGIAYPFPAGGCTSYEDAGAVQHQDSGGTAGMLFVPNMAGT